METLKIQKAGKSKFGYYLLTEDKIFKSTTEPVSRFLQDKTPCEVEVTDQEQGEKGIKITKVRVLNSTPTQADNYGKQYNLQKARDTKHIEMVLSYAKDLVIADKSKNLNDAVEKLMEARDKIVKWDNKEDQEVKVTTEKV
jgi:hypothetical protein